MLSLRRRKLPQPFVDPETDREFLALDLKRQTIIRDLIDRCVEIDKALVKEDAAKWIAERYVGTDTEGRVNTGLSAKTILNTYYKWVKSRRDWRSLDKYRTLYKGEAPPLERYNLDASTVAAWLKRQGRTIGGWASGHGIPAESVSRAINGTRRTASSQRILDMLAAEMRDEPAVLHAEIKHLRADWNTLGQRIAAIENYFAKAKRKIES